MLTKERIDELRKLADKATPGERMVGTEGHPICDCGNSGIDGQDYAVSALATATQLMNSYTDAKHDAAHIAAFDRDTSLALLDAADALRGLVAAAERAVDDFDDEREHPTMDDLRAALATARRILGA